MLLTKIWLALVLLVPVLSGAEIRVMISGGFSGVYQELGPQFELATGHKLVTLRGASMGGGATSIPERLKRGEAADVVIVAASSLDEFIQQGFVAAAGRTDMVRSRIGLAVKAGAARPDISTVEAFKQTLLAAKSVAYSSSASGVYLKTELFPQLGIAEEMKAKGQRISVGYAGEAIVRGEAEIAIQQKSELLPVKGIDFVGLLPDAVQRVTIYAAGVATGSKQAEAGRALIEFLTRAEHAPLLLQNGLEPVRAAAPTL